jgi:hypothetical protein
MHSLPNAFHVSFLFFTSYPDRVYGSAEMDLRLMGYDISGCDTHGHRRSKVYVGDYDLASGSKINVQYQYIARLTSLRRT